MNERLKSARELLSKPGDTIQETLEHIGMSQAELAERMGKTPSKIHDIITGKEPITVNTALLLEKVLGIAAQFWLNSEASYREKLARIEAEEQMEANLEWLKSFPLKQLASCGKLSGSKRTAALVDETLKFFGVANINIWNKVYAQEVILATDFRKSQTHDGSVAAITAWMRLGELEMRKLSLAEFNKDTFKQALTSEIRKLLIHHPDDFAPRLQNICAAAGVALIYTPCLPNAPICGATRWFSGHPLIQMTDRYKTNDQFWFTFYHEAAHVLLHGRRDFFVEPQKRAGELPEKEIQANEFASKLLLPEKALNEFDSRVTELDIKRIAEKYATHPGIVVGRLQHLGKAPFSFGNQLKRKVTLFN